jgi:hypothetical protein
VGPFLRWTRREPRPLARRLGWKVWLGFIFTGMGGKDHLDIIAGRPGCFKYVLESGLVISLLMFVLKSRLITSISSNLQESDGEMMLIRHYR